MSTLPTKTLELLQFCEMHWPIWDSAPASVGLTSAQVLLFKEATDVARSKYDEYQALRSESRAAGVVSRDTIADLRRIGGDTIRFIRAFAEQSADPALVYQAAQIPPPVEPSPLAPPGQPSDFTAQLNPVGSITLRWRCKNPGGQTVYLVQRKLGGESVFTFLGAAGEREYLDASIPVGTVNAMYMVRGQRGTSFGPWSLPFVIMFGVESGGGMMISSQGTDESAAPMKMAA